MRVMMDAQEDDGDVVRDEMVVLGQPEDTEVQIDIVRHLKFQVAR